MQFLNLTFHFLNVFTRHTRYFLFILFLIAHCNVTMLLLIVSILLMMPYDRALQSTLSRE